jgi:hypothetical protein
MIRDYNIAMDAMINPAKIMGGGMGLLPVARTYYVDRNTGVSGDGLSWQNAFLTIGEAIAAVNADYTAGTSNIYSKGRMRRIIIAEGWYSEIPLVLTANDVHIIGVAPGHHDSTVLYGSATAGEYDTGAGGPALSLRGHNCTIENLGLFTYDSSYPALRIGGNASDADGLGVATVVGHRIVGCNFVRDVADGCDGGILDYGADGTLIEHCFFSTSQATYGVKHATNGVINPVNPVVRFCRFVGVPRGIFMAAGHNGVFHGNIFLDDTSDRADTCDEPIYIDGTGVAFDNWAQGVNAADVVTGGGTFSEIRNWGDDTT